MMTSVSKKCVLVVDDEPEILELLAEEFEMAGFDTITATSGNDAIEKLKLREVDAVVSDFRMPNGNGMVILEAIREKGNLDKPVFFFISGQADVSVDAAIKAGAKKFFSKPFEMDEVISIVREACSK